MGDIFIMNYLKETRIFGSILILLDVLLGEKHSFTTLVNRYFMTKN